MDQRSQHILQQADRNSAPVRLTFRDGGAVTARIQDLHPDAVMYTDMDHACRTAVATLEEIVAVSPEAEP